LMDLPRGAGRLPEWVLKNFRDLLEEPDKLKQFRAMQRRLEAARHIAPVPK